MNPTGKPPGLGLRRTARWWWFAAGFACAVFAAGCDDGEAVRVYQVESTPADAAPAPADSTPVDSTAAAEPGTPMPPAEPEAAAPGGGAVAAAGEPWTAPDGWERLPGEQPMRLATFSAGSGAEAVEVAVSRFPGDVGGLLANVNRWRGQIGLPPAAEGDLAEILTPFESRGFAGHTMRLRGPEQDMVAAIIAEPAAERTWFVKAVAAPEVLDRQEAEIVAFARSFGAAGAPEAEAAR